MTEQQNAFLKSAVPAAVLAQHKWGIPASVTIVQAIDESSNKQGWGKSLLASKYNNFFGIKAAAKAGVGNYVQFTTDEFIDGRRVRELAKFARYSTPEASFDAHATLLALTSRYKPAMAFCGDPSRFLRELQLCGYSTNPNYAADLQKLITEFDLTQYDIKPDGPAAAAEEAAA